MRNLYLVVNATPKPGLTFFGVYLTRTTAEHKVYRLNKQHGYGTAKIITLEFGI